jgi:hypothetical protein
MIFMLRYSGLVFVVEDFFSCPRDFTVQLLNFAQLVAPAIIKSVLRKGLARVVQIIRKRI